MALIAKSLSVLLIATSAFAQHDPGRNAVRLFADGKIDKGFSLVQKSPHRLNSPVDAAEIAYVKSMAACLRNRPERAWEHSKKAVELGLPFSRLLAGPREIFKTLYDYPQFKTQVAENNEVLVHGPLLGCVTDCSAKFWVRTARETEIQVVVWKSDADGQRLEAVGRSLASRDYTAIVKVDGLQGDTLYTYEVLIDGANVYNNATFRTQPASGKGARFSIGFGGGAGYTPQYEHMWTTIAGRQLNAFLMLGDNIYIDDPEHVLTHKYCYYRRQSNPLWRAFTGFTPVYSIYDDHDFGDNDCVPGPEIEKPAWKRKVWNVFRQNWNNPSYGGGDKHPGCWYDFYIADVHFIMLDGRYYRDLDGGSMLGSVQKQWLFETLKGSKGRFKVLASPVPWSPGVKLNSRDTWDGFPQEREAIFSFIEKEGVSGVILMAADRHRTDLRKIPRPQGYDLYEVMSSRLTNVHAHPLLKNARGSEFIFGYNDKCSFGELTFDTAKPEPEVTFKCIDIDGREIFKHTLLLTDLKHDTHERD